MTNGKLNAYYTQLEKTLYIGKCKNLVTLGHILCVDIGQYGVSVIFFIIIKSKNI